MPDPNPNPAPQDNAANPGDGADWRASLTGEDATALESLKIFETPQDFFKSYQAATGELKTLKEKAPTFDWRKEVAGEDADLAKQLERFTDPKAFATSWRDAQQRIRSGELLKPLPENATPEQVAQYRKDRGIPEKPEGYLEKLPDGLVIGENDKPIFESFVKGLHELNADPKLAHYAVQWYNDFQEQQEGKAAEDDAAHRTEVEDTLRPEWGSDYRANVNHIKSFLGTLPDGVGDLIANARDSEGRALLNSPKVLKALAKVARELNPVATIVPGTGGNQTEAVADEISKIEKFMRTNRAEYNKDTKMQARLRDLYSAREKLKTRAA
jgi:hypothetical protein